MFIARCLGNSKIQRNILRHRLYQAFNPELDSQRLMASHKIISVTEAHTYIGMSQEISQKLSKMYSYITVVLENLASMNAVFLPRDISEP